MVETMPLNVSKVSHEKHDSVVLPDFPAFDRPLAEHWPLDISWSEAIRQLAPMRDYYMTHFDSAEQRLADKNPEPFVLD